MRYCIWNNKGGVGKTFLSFCLAIEYAIKNPEKNIVAVDMCPQANLSEMILGGSGDGEENQKSLQEEGLTVADYIKKRSLTSAMSKLGNETTYFKKAHDYNEDMPENLTLLCGDMDLDLCSQLINYMGSAPIQGAWRNSRSLLLDLLQTYESNSKKETVFFIDCNPSFSAYTQMAILSSDNIIIPCTADFASIRGIDNVFVTLYSFRGTESKETPFGIINFSSEVSKNGMQLPKVHSFILNKSRTKDSKATKAYAANAKKISDMVSAYTESRPESFIDTQREMVFNIKDGNNLVLVLNHDGLPLSKMSSGKHMVYGEETQVNQDQLDALKSDMKLVIDSL